MSERESTFESVRTRLEQIVDEVSAEGISLDAALALYEEAVKLGLSACDLSEQGALEAAAALEGACAKDSPEAPESSVSADENQDASQMGRMS